MSTNAALAALIIGIESGGNNLAVGDGGRSIGPLQIQASVVADVNRRFKTSFTHAGMTNRSDAIAVMDGYLWIYAQPSRLGRGVTDEDRARIGCGGPNGLRKRTTDAYAAKFIKAGGGR